MVASKLTEIDLRRELSDYRDRYPKLADDHLFVLWFLRAFLTESIDEAANALTGGANDKGIDAILVDQNARSIFIVQGKYREKIEKRQESRADLISFSDIGLDLAGKLEDFKDFCAGISLDIEERLRNCRSLILRQDYRLQLYYVTTGSVSKELKQEASQRARRADCSCSFHVISGSQILVLLSDYLDGVAPPVPCLDLDMEDSGTVQVSGAFHRYDRKTDIESWLFSMTGKAIGELYRKSGDRLFARNVRGFLGNTKINQSMEETIRAEPEFFWYYNNGITIICDHAEQISSHGKNILRVTNPQIINGQQTTRTLAKANGNVSKASVVVKVFRVPRGVNNDTSHFEGLVSQIVSATNWQNAIKPSDLMSNDRRQIEIQRQMRKLGYWYIRKRQTKAEARRAAGSLKYFMVNKFELAQAVAGCNLDPAVIRRGKEGLFEENLYSSIFPTADPYYYLSRFWLMRRVEAVARGYPERAYAKWMVLNFMWNKLEQIVRARSNADKFRRISERGGDVISKLDKSIEKCFVAALRFYRANRGRGAQAIDVSRFFQRVGLHEGFARFWRSEDNTSRNPFNRNWDRFEKAFHELDA